MNCELCGQPSKALKKVIIEYSALRVCPNCARFGKPIPESVSKPSPGVQKAPSDKPATAPKRFTGRDVFTASSSRELATDYPKRVKNARVAKGMTPEQLGKRINEKKSIITKLEAGEMRPNEKLVKKLERNLGIRLMETVEDVEVRKKKARPTVLGDIVDIK